MARGNQPAKASTPAAAPGIEALAGTAGERAAKPAEASTPAAIPGLEALAGTARERAVLPDGWEWRKLSDPDVCSLNPRKTEISSLPNELEVTFVPMAAVDARHGAITDPQIRKLGEVRKGFTYFAEGDVLFAKITPSMENGKAAVARNLKNSLGFGTTEFHILRPGSCAMAEWLYHFIRQKSFREEAASRMSGSAGQQRVPQEFLESVEIPLPPLPEQRRIVARVEALARRVEEIRQRRSEMEAEAHAFLLGAYMQIAEDAPLRPMGGVAPLVRRPVNVESDGLYYEIGLRSFGNGTFHKPAITGEQLGDKRVFHIEPDDLLFSNVFAWEGAIAVAKPEDEGRIGSHRYITCVPRAGVAKSSFLCFHFLTEPGLKQIGEASPGSAGRNRTLGLKALEKLAVPMPPFDKQIWFDALYNKLAELRREQKLMEAELDSLLPSVLAKAFRGEL
ncbi:MAG: restriction endonuclease subunit S [Anaerolineales bacterium]